MKNLLIVGNKSYSFEIEDKDFHYVKYALTIFCLLWRKPSQDRQIKFMEELGYKKKPIKLGQNNSKLVFKCMDEI